MLWNDDDDEPPTKKPKKLSPAQKHLDEFVTLSDLEVCKTTKLEIPWGRDGCMNQKVVWKVHSEMEYITKTPWEVSESPGPDLSHVDFSKPIIDNFFEHLFPDITGHEKIIDEILSDPRAPYHRTYLELGHAQVP